jgi:hypothetical protein
MSQFARALIDSAGDAKGLANGLAWDKLFESRQSVKHPACSIGRQRTSSLMHASRSLLVTTVLDKPKSNKRLGLAPISTVLGLTGRLQSIQDGLPFQAVGKCAMALDDLCSVVRIDRLQEAVKPAEPVVRDA